MSVIDVRVKICGLTRLEDIAAVNEARPDFIGFVFAESRRKISPELARELRAALAPEIVSVGVFVNAAADEILALVSGGIIGAIQLHGGEDENFIRELKAKTTAPVIKAVAVQKPGDAQARENSAADFLLLDHKGGGTGETFDWDLIGGVKKPFFLAGGLTPENISAAREISPYAVDVSSGVEISPGVKCAEKIREFVQNCRKGQRK